MSLDLLEVEINNNQCWIRSRDITCKVSSATSISFQKVVTVYIRRVSTALMEEENFRNSDLVTVVETLILEYIMRSLKLPFHTMCFLNLLWRLETICRRQREFLNGLQDWFQALHILQWFSNKCRQFWCILLDKRTNHTMTDLQWCWPDSYTFFDVIQSVFEIRSITIKKKYSLNFRA